MTHRDTLTDPFAPLRQIADEIDRDINAELAKRARPRHTGIEAAERYLSSHEIPETEPPFPWPFALAVLFIVAVLVAVCALSWDAIAAGVAFLGLAPAAGSSLVAEAGRAMGDEVVR